MAFKIKKYLYDSNKFFIKHILNNVYYGLSSFTFFIDPNNNIYFIINNNYNVLYYNYKDCQLELLSYLMTNKNSYITIDLKIIYSINLHNKDIINLYNYEYDKKRGFKFYNLFNNNKKDKKLNKPFIDRNIQIYYIFNAIKDATYKISGNISYLN